MINIFSVFLVKIKSCLSYLLSLDPVQASYLWHKKGLIHAEKKEYQKLKEKYLDDEVVEVIETIPGWAHDITNVGLNELIVMLWANEVYDNQHPDTIQHKV